MRNMFSLRREKAEACSPASADQFVTVNGTRVRYVELGTEHAGTPLLVVHGYNGSCDYFYPHALPALAKRRHVLALDLPGNGLSDKLPVHTLESYVAFIVAFLDTLRIEQVDLMGHSMGGQIAIAVAATCPERFRKLVLLDSAGLPELIKPMWLAPLRMLTDSSLRQVRLYPTFVKIGLRARAARECLRIIRLHSVRRHLGRLSMPTLIVWGANDRVVPMQHGAFMARYIRGARLAVIRGAGHMPFYEKPEQCSRVVLDFLGG